ncbi:MAG TPA: CDP-alcohol phosphatidyltransferase family protein [Amaricoccus sp.]|nr:CDP-alcohol phosphatidyltransferase family protein [Amaricoccus sp.]
MEQPRDGVEPHGFPSLAAASADAATLARNAAFPKRIAFASPRRGAFAASAAVGAALVSTFAAVPFSGPAACVVGFGLFGLVAAVAIDRVVPFHPHASFGLANVLTLARAAGAALFAGLALEPGLLAGPHAWWALAGAALLLALDGLDGWLSRRQGTASAFGARFDMETDALLILALAALALGLGKAGPWVLGLGLLRYAFLAAGLAWPALARPLPASNRRRAVCALQVATLGLLLAPPVVPPLSTALAATAFAALAASFAIDVAWLLRHAP